jgi:hypothetical protein
MAVNFFFTALYVWVEIVLKHRNSYFSDSEYYFSAGFRDNSPCMSFDGPLLVCFFRLISFSDLSYVVFIFSSIIVYVGAVFRSVVRLPDGQLARLAGLCLFHPFIPFMMARGLKEMLILMPALLLFFLPRESWRLVSAWSTMILTCLALAYLRPFGFYFGLILLGSALVLRGWLERIALPASVLLATFSGQLLQLAASVSGEWFFIDSLNAHSASFDDSERRVDVIPAPVTFVLGPTPVRPIMALFGTFEYSFGTGATVYALLVGSVFSIGCVYYIIKFWAKWGGQLPLEGRFFVYHAVILLITYSALYGGAVDTRHRALFFFCIGVAAVSVARARAHPNGAIYSGFRS